MYAPKSLIATRRLVTWRRRASSSIDSDCLPLLELRDTDRIWVQVHLVSQSAVHMMVGVEESTELPGKEGRQDRSRLRTRQSRANFSQNHGENNYKLSFTIYTVYMLLRRLSALHENKFNASHLLE